ncbi:contactin-associated protein-like 5 isoform X2 [Ictalurus punctatus]|uniref:Contactin-associated protein-like 5 isoform X2 n=1 Tax=Ictalurus punctatus TaxID=7998 RepID=A0A2D0Q724_ICTPU|nr:contactin-associated protein-like 5 isoform X2 [Ictalurus punctatus]
MNNCSNRLNHAASWLPRRKRNTDCKHVRNHCNGPLLSLLPPTSFHSSSVSSESHAGYYAKLNNRDGGGGWRPDHTDRLRWLQVDLRERMEIIAVATQGASGSSDWVTRYTLLYSDTGRDWKQYRHEDYAGVFPGNTDADGVVHHKLPHAIRTRYLLFLPQDWSAEGWIGLRVEAYGCSYKSDLADFDGRSALLYRFNQKSMSTVKDVISLQFKSVRSDGVLVHGEGQRGDYITLELQRGRLALHINLDDAKAHPSSAHVSISLGSLLDDQRWHSVLIERFNKQINFTVDRMTRHLRSGGIGDSLEVDYELSIGGVPLPGKPGTFLRKNFHGCMENLYYNGVNIIDLAKRKKPQIYSVGNVTFSCSEPPAVSATFLSSSSSFLQAPADLSAMTETDSGETSGWSAGFQFRTWNRDAMLMWIGLQGVEKLVLLLSDAQLRLTHHRSALQSSEITVGRSLSDGLWHSVSLTLKENQASVSVDNDSPSSMMLGRHARPGNTVLIGGCPASATNQGCRNPTLAYQGCMRSIVLNNRPLDLYRVQQGLLGNYSGLQIDICGIQDRCLLNYCEHGGECSQSWSSFSCDCSGTGYTGATCHNSIFEMSCEAHRLAGSSSGFFSIDPDGSGPLTHTVVYCNMSEEKVWMVIGHNNSKPVSVQGSSFQKPHVMKLNYSASLQQLTTLLHRAQHCQQEVVYRCRKSRLFNTWDGTPLSWWKDRAGEKRTYWAGLLPGVQQCSCSLAENCIDMNHFCNCDADRSSWENDTGLLSYKEHLPVTEMVVGDTNRSGSEAVYRVGSLQCHGDRFLWNAVSFYQESSSLHYATLHAELSVDISFYFKTTAPSGVFLENLGVRDFIRLELSAPSTVAFSFDVGSGPLVLTVKSHVPLNDKQWHHVRAERNVKEASLQVDQLPLRFLEAPHDGHARLQLNGQLFIGGTASRQKGFLGCIRALTINGMSLDLEERAKMTPGVSAGCPGHCSSQNRLCHNRGRCIERNSGYVCDCTHSAYGGPRCQTEVSVSFESGTSVTYTFQEPFSVTRNTSVQSSAIYAQSSRSRENIAFRFLTTKSPAMLMTVTTYQQQYMAIILARNGSLQIWYKLKREMEPDVFTATEYNLANGQLHRVQLHREGGDMYVQVDKDASQKYGLSTDQELNLIRSLTLGKVTSRAGVDEEVLQAGAKGFIGCLSSVQFNHLAPLKAAILNRGSSLVSVLGNLVESNCGELADRSHSHSLSDHTDGEKRGKERLKNSEPSDSAVIGGLIAALLLVVLCIMAVMMRFLLRFRRERSRQPKEKDLRAQSELRDSRKEYFI